jgi:hypothetical protein
VLRVEEMMMTRMMMINPKNSTLEERRGKWISSAFLSHSCFNRKYQARDYMTASHCQVHMVSWLTCSGVAVTDPNHKKKDKGPRGIVSDILSQAAKLVDVFQ